MQPMHLKLLMTTLFLVMFAGLGRHLGVAPAFVQAEPVSPAEVDALKAELERLKTDFAGMQKDLGSLRHLLSPRPSQVTRPPDAAALVSLAGNPDLGRADAPLTLIEFSDYQCPYCRRFVEATLPALKAEYIDTGRLRYIFRDFPLDRLHLEGPQSRGGRSLRWGSRQILGGA